MLKRKIHKWTTITILILMIANVVIHSYAVVYKLETMELITNLIGYALETPLIIAYIWYLWKYRRIKNDNNTNNERS